MGRGNSGATVRRSQGAAPAAASSPAVTGGLYGSQLGGNLVRAAAAEFIGTFLLVLVGTGVAVAATLNKGSYDGLAVALAFGLVLAALATGLGHISGCHLNPAVTLSLASVKQFPLAYVPAYIAAQVLGAIVASLTVWAGYGARARSEAHLAVANPGPGLSIIRTGLIEAIITFLLVLVVMAVATDDRVPPAAAGLAVGFALFGAVAVGGPLTGGAVNPARALGPMLVSGEFPMWGVYLLAPVIGGIIAAVTYRRVLAPADAPSA